MPAPKQKREKRKTAGSEMCRATADLPAGWLSIYDTLAATFYRLSLIKTGTDSDLESLTR